MEKTTTEQEALDAKVATIWSTASHAHFNCDFRFNSQSTNMQFTPRKTIGGRAWLSIQLPSADHEKALVVWGNTTLGLLLRWWHSNKQQSGRGSITKTGLYTLPVLNVAVLAPQQLDSALSIFEDMKGEELRPVNEIGKDSVRRRLDERFCKEVLGMEDSLLVSGGPLDILRLKLGKEPSIQGGKNSKSGDKDD